MKSVAVHLPLVNPLDIEDDDIGQNIYKWKLQHNNLPKKKNTLQKGISSIKKVLHDSMKLFLDSYPEITQGLQTKFDSMSPIAKNILSDGSKKLYARVEDLIEKIHDKHGDAISAHTLHGLLNNDFNSFSVGTSSLAHKIETTAASLQKMTDRTQDEDTFESHIYDWTKAYEQVQTFFDTLEDIFADYLHIHSLLSFIGQQLSEKTTGKEIVKTLMGR